MKIPYYIIEEAPRDATDEQLDAWILSTPLLMKFMRTAIRKRKRESSPLDVSTGGRPRVDENSFVSLLRSEVPGKELAMNQGPLIRLMMDHSPISYSAARTVLRRLSTAGLIVFDRGEFPWSPVRVWFNVNHPSLDTSDSSHNTTPDELD